MLIMLQAILHFFEKC